MKGRAGKGGKKRDMKRNLLVSAALMAVLFGLAWLALPPAEEEKEEPEVYPQVEPGEMDGAVTLRVKQGDTVTEMTLGEYLQGVVRAEMPASFELEALKAQTVAARTYTLYKIETGGNHTDADICTDSTCCQAWISAEAAEQNWGESAPANAYKVNTAVAETDGMTILYGGSPILAVFHSSAAGRTRNSEDVWSGALPYLRGVESDEDADAIPNYYSTVSFTPEEAREKLLAAHPEMELPADPAAWFTGFVRDGLSVETVHVGGVTLRGTEVRSLFSLRSAAFEVTYRDGKLVFSVTGFGHGVGMSQYGANAMAAQGKTYVEILEHYYTGVEVAPYTPPAGALQSGADCVK